MKKLVWLVLLLPLSAIAAITADNIYTMNNQMGGVAAKVQLGTLVDNNLKIAKVDYDFAVDGGAISTIALGETLPDNAVIVKCYVDIVTALASSSGGGTIALTANSSGDLKAAVDADTLSGVVDCIPTGLGANMVKLTADRALRVEIAASAITAGKFVLFVEYVLSE